MKSASCFFLLVALTSCTLTDNYALEVNGDTAELTYKVASSAKVLPDCSVDTERDETIKKVTIRGGGKETEFDLDNFFSCFPSVTSFTLEDSSSEKFKGSFVNQLQELSISESKFTNLPVSKLSALSSLYLVSVPFAGNLQLPTNAIRLDRFIIRSTDLKGHLNDKLLPLPSSNPTTNDLLVNSNYFSGVAPFGREPNDPFYEKYLKLNCFNYDFTFTNMKCPCDSFDDNKDLCDQFSCHYYKNGCHKDADTKLATWMLVIIIVCPVVFVIVVIIVIVVIVKKKRKANDIRADSYNFEPSPKKEEKIVEFDSTNVSIGEF